MADENEHDLEADAARLAAEVQEFGGRAIAARARAARRTSVQPPPFWAPAL